MSEVKSIATMVEELPVDKIGLINVDISQLEKISSNLIAQAERAEITDEETYAKGGDLIKVAAVRLAEVEANRVELSQPLFDMKKFIDGQFKAAKDEFLRVRKIIEPKMLKWKREEDERIRKEAEEAARKLEEEALARAEEATTEEDQDAVIEAAAAASEELKTAEVTTKRGTYSSTGTQKKQHTEVVDFDKFIRELCALSKMGKVELAGIIDLKKSGLNKLAKQMLAEGIDEVPGAKFIESDGLRVY